MKMLVLFKAGTFSVNYTWQLRGVGGEWKIAHQSIAIQGKLDAPKA
jgi:hypothetical protein